MAKSCPPTPQRRWVFPYNLFSKGGQNWLIIQRISTHNFEVRGSNLVKLCHMTCHKRDIITYIQYLGGSAPLKFAKAKTSKIRRDLWQLLTLTVNISRTGQYIENRKQTSLKVIPAALNKKLVNFCALIKKVIDADVDPPRIDCARDFEQLQSLVANISGRDQDINNGKRTLLTATPSVLDQKNWWILVH